MSGKVGVSVRVVFPGKRWVWTRVLGRASNVSKVDCEVSVGRSVGMCPGKWAVIDSGISLYMYIEVGWWRGGGGKVGMFFARLAYYQYSRDCGYHAERMVGREWRNGQVEDPRWRW